MRNDAGKSTTMRLILGLDAIGAGRVDQVLALTGLKDVATKRVGGFSLGMSQRLRGISLDHPEAVRAVFGATLYLTVVAVLARRS